MKSRVRWVDGVKFLGESGSGHAVLMDGAAESGGTNLGPRPMEMLLLGLGGCTSFDVITILKKMREPVQDCVAEIEATRAETDPKVFTRIHVAFIVTGRNLSREKVERAVHLSADKYCSASLMLAKTAEITHSVEIVEAP